MRSCGQTEGLLATVLRCGRGSEREPLEPAMSRSLVFPHGFLSFCWPHFFAASVAAARRAAAARRRLGRGRSCEPLSARLEGLGPSRMSLGARIL